MGHSKARLRLFVGVYPPVPVAADMLAALRALDVADHRETPADQIHLTIQFIGDTDPRRLDEVTESVARAAGGLAPFDLCPARLTTLPERGRPRLIALETDAPPSLLELKRRLVHRLARNVRTDAADRFLPHFTLCRFPRSASPSPLNAPAAIDAFQISTVYLMRSVLLPEGAQHRHLGEFRLG